MAEISGCDQHAAPDHGAPLAHQPVGHPAAGKSEEIDAGSEDPVDRRGGSRAHPKPTCGHGGSHEQDEDPAPTIKAEALPHLREEESGQAAWMSKKRSIARANGRGSAWIRTCGIAHQLTCLLIGPRGRCLDGLAWARRHRTIEAHNIVALRLSEQAQPGPASARNRRATSGQAKRRQRARPAAARRCRRLSSRSRRTRAPARASASSGGTRRLTSP